MITTQNHIKKIGIELEGAWPKSEVYTADESNHIDGFHQDGSVRIMIDRDEDEEEWWLGEFASPPMNLEEVDETIRSFWPEKYNQSCGLHMHISVDTKEYSRLMDKVFYKIFLKKIREVGENLPPSEKERLHRRLEGGNTYCQRGWKADQQATRIDKDDIRYYHLNYCWALHGTMEIRVLPMMRWRDFVPIRKEITGLINRYLDKKPRNRKWTGEVTDETPPPQTNQENQEES